MNLHRTKGAGPRFGRLRLRGDAKRGEATMRPFPSVPLGQLVGCSAGLIFAGLLLARGFVGFRPGDPLVIVFGVVLAVSATLGLSTDHVAVRAVPQRPQDVLTQELNRCRRHGHPMAMLATRCEDEVGRRIVTRLRSTDHGWWSGPDFVMLLPETTRVGAVEVVDRIEDLVERADVRVALFPDDGLTAQALHQCLTEARRPNGERPAPPHGVQAVQPLAPAPKLNGSAQAEAG